MSAIRRCFVEVAGRAVHYRRAGSGPPVVMLHGSPGDSQMLLAEIAACAGQFTVFALDTAGFGYSDALPGEVLSVRDLAAAAAETLRALGLPPCPVYGTHTGAAIAIELGLGWPEQVTGLVMEGLPAFTEAEMAEFFRCYFAPMLPDPLGGHLINNFIRFRDQFTWFPWPSRDVRRLNALNRPEPADIDLWVAMFYRSCKSYKPAYYAACHYGAAALRAAAALAVPAIYMAAVEDMLFGHLQRLPPLKAGQRIAPLPSGAPGRNRAIVAYLGEFAGIATAPPHRQMAASGRILVDGPHGQVFVRLYGNPGMPALVLLHDVPGTSLTLAGLAQAFATTHYVIVPDHPGSGLSDAVEGDVLTAAADHVLAVADALGLAQFCAAASGCGAAVAAQLAARAPARVRHILIADAAPRDPARIAPEIPLSPTGAHWVQAWLMLRDNQIYKPWYDGTVAAQRQTQGNFAADYLHDETAALMEGRASYHVFARAAAGFPAVASLSVSFAQVTKLPDDAFTSGFNMGDFL